MVNKDIIENIFFNDIIPQAKNGEVKITVTDQFGEEEYIFNVGFNTYLESSLSFDDSLDSKPILIINNKNKLIDLLYEYVNLCEKDNNIFSKYDLNSRIRCYLTNLWANALYEDFANPALFVKKQINYYNNKLCDTSSFVYNNLDDFEIRIEDIKQDIRMETPYVFKVSLCKNNEIYKLPKISYAIDNDICYIYAIQNEICEITTPYQKKIKRLLYKLNDGVSALETDEYQNYKNGDDYYPENISDVSPSTLLSLSIFFDIVKNKGYDKVKVISLLPIRYNSRLLALKKRYNEKVKNSKLNNIEQKKIIIRI